MSKQRQAVWDGHPVYANDYREKLPQMTSGNWAWDIPWNVADLMTSSGTQRHVMYDPGFPDQDNDILWNFVANSFRVIGYAMTFPGTASMMITNQNPSILPQAITYGAITYPPPSPCDRPLLACSTISYNNNVANRNGNMYTGIDGGWNKPHRTSHLKGALPAGGNVGKLDGSAR
jgi:hypothetical protein